MDLERYKEYSLMTVTITLAFCAAFLLGGLSRAIFVELSIASVWLFLKTLNRRIFQYFQSTETFLTTIFPNGCGVFL